VFIVSSKIQFINKKITKESILGAQACARPISAFFA